MRSEVQTTNLLDDTDYPAADFSELYHRRWRIEEAFHHLKSRLQLKQVGGETPLAIRQVFHATILLHNLATLAAMDTLSQRGATHPSVAQPTLPATPTSGGFVRPD